MMVIINESYAAYENKVEAPPQDANGGYLDATATKNNSINNVIQFLKIKLFRAALPGDIREVVAQHNQNTITLYNMYQVATDTQRKAGSKTMRNVAAVNEDSNSDAKDIEDEIAAFQNRRNKRFPIKSKKPISVAPQHNNRYKRILAANLDLCQIKNCRHSTLSRSSSPPNQ
jgi:gas vesicle protein